MKMGNLWELQCHLKEQQGVRDSTVYVYMYMYKYVRIHVHIQYMCIYKQGPWDLGMWASKPRFSSSPFDDCSFQFRIRN